MAQDSILGGSDLNGSEDEVDFPPNDYVYRKRDMAFVVVGILTLLTDWIFDIVAAYNHWCHDDFAWFTLTVIFMSSSSLVIMIVSLRWYVKDTANEGLPSVSKCKWSVRLLLLVLQLGPLLRYYDTLNYGLKSRKYWRQGDTRKQKEYFTLMLYEDSDSVFLRMFECFMEAAPQLVLQLYILTQIQDTDEPAKYGGTWQIIICLSSLMSLVSLAWGVTAYARGVRFTQHNKNNISFLGSFVIFLWHFFCLAARVIALVLFASCFRMVVMWVCLGHWLLMTFCLMVRRSFKDTSSTVLSEILLSVVFGAVYIFVFLNDKDELTRWKYTVYYIVWEIENVVLVVMFLMYSDPALCYYTPAVVVHWVAFGLGLIFMAIYYCILHPSKDPPAILPLPRDKDSASGPPNGNVYEPQQTEL